MANNPIGTTSHTHTADSTSTTTMGHFGCHRLRQIR